MLPLETLPPRSVRHEARFYPLSVPPVRFDTSFYPILALFGANPLLRLPKQYRLADLLPQRSGLWVSTGCEFPSPTHDASIEKILGGNLVRLFQATLA